jgi:hypothetical protein
MEAMGAMSAGIMLEAIKAVDAKRDVPVVRKKIAAQLVPRETTAAIG